jgi:hypothetical protein
MRREVDDKQSLGLCGDLATCSTLRYYSSIHLEFEKITTELGIPVTGRNFSQFTSVIQF